MKAITMVELEFDKGVLRALRAYINPNSSLIKPIESALQNAKLTNTAKLVIKESQLTGLIEVLDEMECSFAYTKEKVKRAKAMR